MNLSTAKVIARTVPTQNISATDANEFIAYVARVSNPSNQSNTQTSNRLINYLLKHKHFSPFEHYYLTLEIETPKDIAIQLLRHRSLTFQEFSGRYQDINELDNPFIIRDTRLQDKTNRQNSLPNDDENLELSWQIAQQEVIATARDAYNKALEQGIAKEIARSVLPIGLVKSRLYVTGNIRSFIHYLQVRLDPTTQKEHRQLACAIYDALLPYFDLNQIKELADVKEKA
ncbi:FAD-dependent thymidylate synthase [Moraxella marmotae]|uniref:FAD-dependent thymidylate synthase n=1 Tax=Moraxella marmotae TaxID=3344520 RepID=UPI0035D43158